MQVVKLGDEPAAESSYFWCVEDLEPVLKKPDAVAVLFLNNGGLGRLLEGVGLGTGLLEGVGLGIGLLEGVGLGTRLSG